MGELYSDTQTPLMQIINTDTPLSMHTHTAFDNFSHRIFQHIERCLESFATHISIFSDIFLECHICHFTESFFVFFVIFTPVSRSHGFSSAGKDGQDMLH